jgi:peptidyl-prolyl cis-trans isomerase SurA
VKYRFATILIILSLVAAYAPAQLIDKPAATVTLTEPEFISVQQLNEQIRQFDALRSQGVSGLPTDPLVILDSMIQELLLKQGARGSNVRVSDSEVDAYIAQIKASAEVQTGGAITEAQFRELVFKQTGLSWDEYRDSIREQRSTIAYVRIEKKELFDAMATPPTSEIETYFRRNATSFNNPEIVRFSEIYIDTRNLTASEKQKARERAESIRKAFENGEGTFARLVEQYSDDTRARYSGGDKGYFTRNDPRTSTYGEAFFDTLFSLETNAVSSVVSSNIGYHIVKVTEHIDPKLLKLDDPIYPGETQTVRDYIRAAIVEQREQQVFAQALKELVSELKARADIKIFEANINS